MLPFQLPGFVAFGIQFDGLFQIFEGAILVSFQVLGTAPFGVCFAEIGFQINRFVEERMASSRRSCVIRKIGRAHV